MLLRSMGEDVGLNITIWKRGWRKVVYSFWLLVFFSVFCFFGGGRGGWGIE